MGQAAELAAGFMETKTDQMFKQGCLTVFITLRQNGTCRIWTRNGSSDDGENEAENRLQCIFGNRYRILQDVISSPALKPHLKAA